ncbi:hypothetical protein KAT59_02645 [Candidatus Bipolaricaulota bacterium]|nr:hypothetical protein [Candidatus Bipolaricaulota bacterium]
MRTDDPMEGFPYLRNTIGSARKPIDHRGSFAAGCTLMASEIALSIAVRLANRGDWDKEE